MPRWSELVCTAGPALLGLYDPTKASYYLRYSNTEGGADNAFGYGAKNWEPIAGDWNGDGIDTIGAFQRSAAQFYLRKQQ